MVIRRRRKSTIKELALDNGIVKRISEGIGRAIARYFQVLCAEEDKHRPFIFERLERPFEEEEIRKVV